MWKRLLCAAAVVWVLVPGPAAAATDSPEPSGEVTVIAWLEAAWDAMVEIFTPTPPQTSEDGPPGGTTDGGGASDPDG